MNLTIKRFWILTDRKNFICLLPNGPEANWVLRRNKENNPNSKYELRELSLDDGVVIDCVEPSQDEIQEWIDKNKYSWEAQYTMKDWERAPKYKEWLQRYRGLY